jgi:hypothetical protein
VVPVLLSIDEVDAALSRANQVPEDERTDMWQGIVDALLDRRAALAGVEANLRDIRVMRAKELR